MSKYSSENSPPLSEMLEAESDSSPTLEPFQEEKNSLPSPPGPKRKKEEKILQEKLQEEQPPNPEVVALKEKPKIPVTAIAIGALALLLILILLKPSPESSQQATQIPQENTIQLKEEIQELSIKIQQLTGSLKVLQKERDEGKEKIEQLQQVAKELKTQIANTNNKADENRNYISTIYRQVLDTQLKIEAFGGGFQDLPKQEPPERVINPYIGEDNLP